MGQMPWETQVLDKKTGRKVACALLHQLEGLAETRGFELIILVQHTDGKTIYEGPADAMAVRSVLSCLSDQATRVLDLQPVLSELKVKHPSRYKRLFNIHMTAEGNELVGLELSKNPDPKHGQQGTARTTSPSTECGESAKLTNDPSRIIVSSGGDRAPPAGYASRVSLRSLPPQCDKSYSATAEHLNEIIARCTRTELT